MFKMMISMSRGLSRLELHHQHPCSCCAIVSPWDRHGAEAALGFMATFMTPFSTASCLRQDFHRGQDQIMTSPPGDVHP